MSALCPYVKHFYSILLNSEKFQYAITGFLEIDNDSAPSEIALYTSVKNIYHGFEQKVDETLLILG